jgi:hypothetical protein
MMTSKPSKFSFVLHICKDNSISGYTVDSLKAFETLCGSDKGHGVSVGNGISRPEAFWRFSRVHD